MKPILSGWANLRVDKRKEMKRVSQKGKKEKQEKTFLAAMRLCSFFKSSGRVIRRLVRNIRIVTPGFEETYETSPFHPAFLASLENFTVLRFMDWMHANSGNTPEEWEDRVTPSYYTQGSHPGVSLEYMVRLSNEVGAEPWFSVPVNATDDYIQNFVQYVSESYSNIHNTCTLCFFKVSL